MRLSSKETIERYEARTHEFQDGVISEPVYRAALFALGYRGQDIETEVSMNRPPPSVPPWVGVVARAIAVKAAQNKTMTLAEWEREIAALWRDNAGQHHG